MKRVTYFFSGMTQIANGAHSVFHGTIEVDKGAPATDVLSNILETKRKEFKNEIVITAFNKI